MVKNGGDYSDTVKVIIVNDGSMMTMVTDYGD